VQNQIRLFDRVKELTYSQGTTNFALAGAADGFSALDRFYEHNEVVFYAVTDGLRYEVGSGVYRRADYDPGDSITYNELQRYPFRTSNPDNSIVNFPPGVKEVFITYPATHSVMMGSGIPNINVPQRRGVAVWDSENILNYFSAFTYNNSLKSLGINQPNHFYGVDVGGDGMSYESRIRASGYFVGGTGIYFQSGNGANANLQLSKNQYAGGTQYVHFKPNITDDQLPAENQTNSHLVIQVSGDVNEYILLQKQDAHTVFSGPIDDCNPSCSEGYPTFRRLVVDDLPMVELSGIFTSFDTLLATSGSLVSYVDSSIVDVSGHLRAYASGIQNNLDVHVSGYQSDFRDLEVAISGKVDTYLHRVEHENPYCTVRGDNVDGYNAAWTNDNQTSNYVIFPFSHVESESTTGDWDTINYRYTVPRSGTYAVTADVGASYVSSDGDVDNYFRLVTSGNGSTTNYLSTAIFMGDPADNNASSSWTVNVPSGEFIYLEYQGQPRNFSKLSIHKV
jgi:hypothetical protein